MKNSTHFLVENSLPNNEGAVQKVLLVFANYPLQLPLCKGELVGVVV